VHSFYKMFVKNVYSQTRNVSIHIGTIIRGSTENCSVRFEFYLNCFGQICVYFYFYQAFQILSVFIQVI
jgi:hypothetical protein